MDLKVLSEYLTSIGCCSICVLRFLNPRIDDFFDVLKKTDEEKFVCKKQKLETCVACFGLFEFLDEVVLNIKGNEQELNRYEIDRMITSFTLPISMTLAQLQIWLALIENFPKCFDSEKPPDMSIKDVIKNLLNRRLADELRKELHPDGMMINIFFVIDNEKDMTEKLEKVAPELMVERLKQRKKFRTEIISRNYFEKFFVPKNIKLENFRKEFSVPPNSVATSLRLDKITFLGPTVFMAGRYNKFSRKLSQSPWILNGKRMSEESVQEIIVEAIAPNFKVPSDSITFMSSGREDVDVRCLGRGRPFVLEVMNSAKTILEASSAIQMEKTVNRSKLVFIRDLQMIPREDVWMIKSGEEDKKKIYRALCTINHNVTLELLEKLQISNEFVIQQWTPLRVLHRRTLMKRPRTIFSVKSHAIKGKPNLIILDFVTQAGTYVKELVHGEFGRTFPSISSIIGMDIDIAALDVMNIDMDFPKSLNRR